MIDPSLVPLDDRDQRDRLAGQTARVLRERQEILHSAIDRAIGLAPAAAARRLVSVYNGGNMPTQPDHVYFTHPVGLDGTEAEGETGSTTVDTSATIPVVVLRGAAQAGDLLVASAVGGRWVAERSSGACNTTVCVSACAGIPVMLATISLLDPTSGQTVASCTTSTDGCCVFDVCGTFIVQVTISGTLTYNSARILAAGGTTRILLGSTAPVVCCAGYAIPTTLSLTDAEGTLTFVYDPSWYYPMWTGGHSVQRLSATVSMPTGICEVGTASMGPVRICYQMICYANQTPQFAVQRSWSYVYSQATLQPVWYQDSTNFFPGQPCITAPPPLCGNPLTDTASFNANPTTANPFVLNGTPAAASSNVTTDPVGGSIVISA